MKRFQCCIELIIVAQLYFSVPLHGQEPYKETFIVSGLGWLPLASAYESLNPAFGGHVARIQPHLRGSFDVSFSSFERSTEEMYGVPVEGGVQLDYYFYGFTLDYLWGKFPNGRLSGTYFGLGVGYYWEHAKASSQVLTASARMEWDKGSVTGEVIIGHLFKRAEIFVSYTVLPGFTLGTNLIKAGIGFYVGGER